MRVLDFAQKYGVSEETIWVNKSTGRIPKEVFYKPINDSQHIDESYFLRRKNFKRKIQLQNQELYYWAIESIQFAKIAKAISSLYGCHVGSVVTYVNGNLFYIDDTSIMSTKVPDIAWMFNKYMRMLFRDIKRLAKVKQANVTHLLDRRMYAS